jgi:hypothetical protein
VYLWDDADHRQRERLSDPYKTGPLLPSDDRLVPPHSIHEQEPNSGATSPLRVSLTTGSRTACRRGSEEPGC